MLNRGIVLIEIVLTGDPLYHVENVRKTVVICGQKNSRISHLQMVTIKLMVLGPQNRFLALEMVFCISSKFQETQYVDLRSF